MNTQASFNQDPDFFIIAENDVSLLFIAGLINSVKEVQVSKTSKVFETYKNTIVTLSDITNNRLKNITHPFNTLHKTEGSKLKNDTFNIKNGNDQIKFGVFISRLIKENIDKYANNKNIHSKAIEFLSYSRSNNLTFKNLFNSILSLAENTDTTHTKHNGIAILSNVDESDFLSGIYPESKFIRVLYDLSEEDTIKAKNQCFHNTLTSDKSNIFDIRCSDIFNSPNKYLPDILTFIQQVNTSNDENNKASKKPTKIVPPIDAKEPDRANHENPIGKNVAHNEESLLKDPDFFITGPPRSGTSLLSVLLNDHSSIAIAQDSGIYSEFISAATLLGQINNQQYTGKLNLNEYLLLKDDFGKLIRENTIDLTSNNDVLLINLFFTGLIRFLFVDFLIPDPRKDRGTGMKYLNYFDFQYALNKTNELKLPFKSLLNYCVNSIIDGEGLSGEIRGEKTPTHIMHPSFLRGVYPNAKFINIIRNPLGFVGSRHQRLNNTIKEHCYYYRSIVEQMIESDERTITVKYEDLIENPKQTIKILHNFLGVKETEISDKLNPGAYPKYVGQKIDKNRDKKNMDALTADMIKEIKYHLKDVFEIYYPSLL